MSQFNKKPGKARLKQDTLKIMRVVFSKQTQQTIFSALARTKNGSQRRIFAWLCVSCMVWARWAWKTFGVCTLACTQVKNVSLRPRTQTKMRRYTTHTKYPAKMDAEFADCGPGARKGLNWLFLGEVSVLVVCCGCGCCC